MAKNKTENNGLLSFNPLMSSPAISVDDENNMKGELIEKTENLAVLNEEYLKVEQRKANLEIELRKIGETKKFTDVINSLIDLGLSEEIITNITSDLKGVKELKMYSEAIKNFAEVRNKNMNNVQDEFGNRKRTKIVAQFQTQSGEKASIGVSIGNDDD